jgi:hypothetical protein
MVHSFFMDVIKCRRPYFFSHRLLENFDCRLGPDGGLLGDRRHKDELDSGDDSDAGRQDNEEVSTFLVNLNFQGLNKFFIGHLTAHQCRTL